MIGMLYEKNIILLNTSIFIHHSESQCHTCIQKLYSSWSCSSDLYSVSPSVCHGLSLLIQGDKESHGARVVVGPIAANIMRS